MDIRIDSQAQTEAVAQELAKMTAPGDVIAFHGDLGVGKSVFSRAFIRALTTPDEEVPSPTFTLVQIYEAEVGEIYHFDMYRLESPDDSLELGIEEAFADGISLIEWPSKLGNYLPWDCLNIEIAPGETETSRTITFSSQGAWLARLKETSFDGS
ncbi:tRNA (adenosine(37)-N6)-threonylcarbamoyltransferase complex ATPase subunit type 1 TsaE [Terasakiella sp. A23]|uniref:tRNA (adenosine(37)-N6)-threonylcarbamoyltransferase complex ATPase subunit type 1 TsaE n=1 Tax=Terasakiella sp. FCG-A23 TaxID=3080561 RepID=UPI002954F94E|nr:tRNA (adenosine(37)-N6)-threonylcarbamoyltransferase complex ATPase subunit type 1 TsaE [Terasakiella sp. A23]MDV7337985.1 tRNA (adenosine(37)-N6)-threonylcarbamoyltransferase complex ATPase subunit type 1 TsaE [Terasakiella sp. A23]